VRAYAERVEDLGYRHVLAFDHVVGADPKVHTGWSGPYDVETTSTSRWSCSVTLPA
jgi:hypothetical protein